MKHSRLTALLVAGIMLGGCSSQPSMPQPSGHSDQVHVGMTEAEVLKALGHKPRSIEQTPNGEVWHYDNRELAMIPFNFGFRPEFKNFVFDKNGILVDYSINQPTK